MQHTQRSHVLGRLNFFMTDNWFLISVSHIHNWTEPQPILMDQNWNGSVDGSLIWAQLRPAGHQLDCKSAPSDRAGIQETWGAACTATCAATPCRDHHCTPPWRHAKAATTIQSCTYATADTVTPRPQHRVLVSQTTHDVSLHCQSLFTLPGSCHHWHCGVCFPMLCRLCEVQEGPQMPHRWAHLACPEVAEHWPGSDVKGCKADVQPPTETA